MGVGKDRRPHWIPRLSTGHIFKFPLCPISFVADVVVTWIGAEVIKKRGTVQIEMYCLN